MDGVEAHYTRPGVLRGILEGLRANGADPEAPTVEDLAPFDELHLGALPAVHELIAMLDVGHGDHLLDVGSGLGGPARAAAAATGCRVTGVDLSSAFVDAATELTARAGLGDRVTFLYRDAVDTGLDAGSATAAWQIHAGMNIPDKAAVFAEVRRVLRPASVFLVYDVMAGPAGTPPPYPLPWASEPEISHLATPDAYAGMLAAAGFRVEEVVPRRDAALAFLGRAVGAEGGPVPPRPGTPDAETTARFANLRAAIGDDRLTVQVIAARAG